MLTSIARHWLKLTLRVHAKQVCMVVTRRAVKTEAIVDDKHALQKTIVVMSAPEPSNKRRKISKPEALPEDGVKVVTAAVEPLSPILHPLKAAKRKARPKLLQTLHTKETLPAIQEKAAQVSGANDVAAI